MKSLTRAQQKVLKMIEDNPHIRPLELRNEMNLGHRSISNSLKELKRKNLIKRVPDLMDMRKAPYVAI